VPSERDLYSEEMFLQTPRVAVARNPGSSQQRRQLGSAVSGTVLLMSLACPIVTGAVSNFRYDLKLLVNDQPVEFHIPWRCKEGLEGPNFGPGGLIQRVMKPTISISWIARSIASGVVIFSPMREYCIVEAPDYDPSIYLMDNATNPTSLQIFTRLNQMGLGYTVSVVTSSIVELAKAEPDYSDTREERDLLKSVRNSCSGYQRIAAYIYPESIWGKSQHLIEQLNKLTTVTLGPFAHLDTIDFKSNFSISLVRKDGTWRLPPSISSQGLAEVYFPLDGPRETTDKLRAEALGLPAPPASIEIDTTNVSLGAVQTYVYDPRNRWLMRLMNQKLDCWSLR
jgi:hypothetical protein